jgi:hypothetical protein
MERYGEHIHQSGGWAKGYRTSNQFMEQLGSWASQRQWN